MLRNVDSLGYTDLCYLTYTYIHTYSAMRNCGGPDIWRERTYRGGLVGRGSVIVLVVMILIYYTN